MTTDRPPAPTGGFTYKGFAGPPPEGEPHLRFDGRPPPAPRRRRKPALIAGGVAAALALGVGLGLLARPDLGVRRDAPMAPAAAAGGGGSEQMQIAVAPALPPAPPPAAADDAPLEVLPPDYARAAEAQASDASARAPAPPPAPVRERPRIPRREAPVIAAAPAPPRIVEAPPPPRLARPSFDCDAARTRAENMVCADPELAAADRRLARAFRRATESGIPYRALRAEQDDWLSIREDAARRSPAAVASVYEQRIEELNAMARGEY